MKKDRLAIVVGIDHYEHLKTLRGCVNDAKAVATSLARHGTNSDGERNFGVTLLTSDGGKITKRRVKDEVKKLFDRNFDIALFYFAGHGYIESTGGYICTSECESGDDGLPLAELVDLANTSKAKSRVIILDSCHSGMAGAKSTVPTSSEVWDGVTILTASTKDEEALESGGRGLFTTLMVEALNGGAANLSGDVTPGSVYAFIDQSLAEHQQRPVFKTNVQEFISLKQVEPAIGLHELRELAKLFPSPNFEFKLDPTYEPERERDYPPNIPDPILENTRKFALLQKYNRCNLLKPDAKHMWHAAMGSKACRLTALGEHYRRLVAEGRI